MTSAIGAETAILTAARFSLFYACRKYLLRALYSDLRSLSTSATPGTPTHSHRTHSPLPENGDGTIELDALPLPTTHTPKSSRFLLEDATYLHIAVARTIFAWCFAESCMMFFLLMLQGWGVFSARTRLINWQFSLFFLMGAILIVIPLAVSMLLAIGTTESRSVSQFFGPRAILSLVPVALYLFALSYIPLPVSLEPSDTATATLSRLIVLGTIILGLLSGFGAVSSSWKFLPFRNRIKSVPSEQDLDTAQYALTSIRNDMKKRREEATRREGATVEGSWFSRVGSSFRGSDSLTQEMQGLEALEYQMNRNLEALRERRETARFAGTFKGRIFNFAGKLFTAYCVIRIISSMYNVLFRTERPSSSKTSYPDLITDLLAYAVTRFSSQAETVKYEDIASFARQLSLVLVGIIILSSIRLVLRGATRVLRVTSRNLAASVMLLVLAQIMGIYLLSTVVQMRSSFPPPPSGPSLPPATGGGDTDSSDPDSGTEATSNLFTTIPAYEVFGALFDWSFLMAAAASLFVRWGAERVNGTGDE